MPSTTPRTYTSRPSTSFCFVLAFALLGSCAGCKDSSQPSSPERSDAPKTPQTAPSRVAAAAPVSKPVPGGVPLWKRTPVKTFRITPPVAFSSSDLPPEGVSEFLVSGKAGQFLLVKTRIGESIVQSPSGGDLPMPPGGGYAKERAEVDFIYALSETGTYRILFESPSHKGSLEVSFLEKTDPILDTGIAAEDVSVDFGDFAPGRQLSIVPYSHFQEEGEDYPSHLAVEGNHSDFRIMSVVAFNKLFPEEKSIAHLKQALEKGSCAAKPEDLPYPRSDWWDGYIMSVRCEILRGDGWSGLRWIGGFGGDEGYPSEGLGYVFNGITDDGRYLIVMRSDLSHPDQKRFYPVRPRKEGPDGSYEISDPEAETKGRALLEKSLVSAAPSSFAPDLAKLDAVLHSLKIRH